MEGEFSFMLHNSAMIHTESMQEFYDSFQSSINLLETEE